MSMRWISLVFTSIVLASAAVAKGPIKGEVAITFESQSGEAVEAFQGEFHVPENRSDPGSRTLTLRYVRFPATNESNKTPIVYLAGGPGGPGSGTARGRRFPLFMAMRGHGDVIAFDQRGTGESTTLPKCVSGITVPHDEIVSDSDYEKLHRAAARECAEFWRSEGVDIRGYTTRESVEDLDALRRHLGAGKISLWGISYGSHLALAAMKYRDEILDKVILASAEGLDQTVKLPSRTDAYFLRLQEALHRDPKMKENVPDLLALMHRVHDRLASDPARLAMPDETGETVNIAFDRRAMRQIASYMIADPQQAMMLVQLYLAVDQAFYPPVVGLLSRFYDPHEPITFSAMPLAMDIASGIGEERLRQVNEQARSSLLGDVLNFPMPHLRGAIEGLDLGDEFRSGPVSDVPTLLLTGTLDGRTYIEGQSEAVAGLTNLTQVLVVNAGHNLFMASPEVGQAMRAFMSDSPIPSQRIEVVLPPWNASY